MSQAATILAHLLAGESITPLRALELTGSIAMHSRASELRSWGFVIDCEVRHEGRRKYGVYTVAGLPKSSLTQINPRRDNENACE